VQVNRLAPIVTPTAHAAGSPAPIQQDILAARDAVPASERAAWTPVFAREAQPVAAPELVATQAASTATGPDAATAAELAQDVYLDVAQPPAGYRVATTAELARIGVTPAMLADQPNGFRARAYVTGEGDAARVTIAFRGSQQGGDWLANARQAVGLNTDHYSSALLLGRAVAQSGADTVSFTGHSLGGGLASAAGLAGGAPATTFNAAGLSGATLSQADQVRTAAGHEIPDIRAYFIRGEVLSALQDGGDRVAGALLFGPLGAMVDAPEAYGTRIGLDAVAPEGKRFWEHNPIDRHGMDWVRASLP
jgi:hypothetical protein